LNSKINKQKDENSGLHPLNKHHASYNFTELVEVCPELKSFVIINKFKIETIDFTNADAVKMLNKALLQKFYGITHWDIPKNYLCPPIPGRADYIHNIADLLSSSNGGIIPKGKSIRVLDIGVGANCIYPLIGHKEYGWYFVGSDSDAFSVKVASQIVSANDLSNVIDIRYQANVLAIFKGIIRPTELIDITICNPPFHSSAEEAQFGSSKKWKNLGYKKTVKPVLNFGGQTNELWCKGGEVGFITRMIFESIEFKERSLWFTSLVSKSEHLNAIYVTLKKAGVVSVKTIQMAQGNKVSRLVAWTFLNEMQHIQWSLKRWK